MKDCKHWKEFIKLHEEEELIFYCKFYETFCPSCKTCVIKKIEKILDERKK